MLKSHAEAVLERLHDQYLRGSDCDVILTAADHLGQNGSGTPNDGSPEKLNWTSLSCHKIVLRAVSSFFDRIFLNKYTYDKMKFDENVEGVLVSSEGDVQVSLQVTLHEISSHSLQALVNFAYTGSVAIETTILKRAIADFKRMNVSAIIDKLETCLEDLSFANCIPNLIISYTLDRKEKHRKALMFILEEFFRGFKSSNQCEETWRNYLEADLPLSEINAKIKKLLQTEIDDDTLEISEDTRLLNVLISLIDTRSISLEEETKLLNFLVTKRREKCSIHLQNIQLYCYTDDKELCVECLVDGHDRHSIKPVNTAKYRRLAPYWEKMDQELEGLKESTHDRIIELDFLMEKIRGEKSRDLAILDSCAQIKPKMDNFSNIFQSGKLGSNEKDLLALEQFLAVLEKETSRSKDDYMEAKQISDDLLILMEKRCSSCASIVDATLDVETMEDLEEIDLDLPLSIHNCISILKRSKKDENLQLYEKAFNFVVENFIDVVNELGNSFHRRISHRILEHLLPADALKVNSEDEVVSIVTNWLQFDFRQRKRFASQLFQQVRFGCLSETVLVEIKSDPYHVIMLNEESKALLDNAIAGNSCQRPRGFHEKTAFGFAGCENNQRNFEEIIQRMIPEHQRDRKSKTGAAINEVPTSSNATSDLTDGSDRTSGFLFGAKTMPELSFSSLAASGSFGLGNKTALQGKRISNSPLSKAIVKLSKVEARSTEENDEVIFSQRAKLFHLVDQEWKERGVGDAKVLRYAAKNLGKFVMRRDIVLKFCANHVIFEETELTSVPNLSGKGFIWVARDFAEYDTEGSVEKFLITFKNVEIGSEFEAAFNIMRQLAHLPTTTD